MIKVWRLVKKRYAASAFDGEGARLYGGRWNSPGIAVAYASSTIPLAVLEVLVHLQTSAILQNYSLVTAAFDDKAVEDLRTSALPINWKLFPPPPETQAIGDAWIASSSSLVLRVPSVVIDTESNYLINVQHPEIRKLRVSAPEPFEFDPRLLPK